MEYVTIEKLRSILIEELNQYTGWEPVPLNFESELLRKIMFTEGKFYEELKDVVKKINFSNVSFDGFDASMYDFSSLRGVKINPQTIKDKNLTNTICQDVEFIGPFDGAQIDEANFTGSKGAKINPQTIFNKSLYGTICANVEFIGTFDGTLTEGASFKGSNYNEIIGYEESFRSEIRNKILVLENRYRDAI